MYYILSAKYLFMSISETDLNWFKYIVFYITEHNVVTFQEM